MIMSYLWIEVTHSIKVPDLKLLENEFSLNLQKNMVTIEVSQPINHPKWKIAMFLICKQFENKKRNKNNVYVIYC